MFSLQLGNKYMKDYMVHLSVFVCMGGRERSIEIQSCLFLMLLEENQGVRFYRVPAQV